MNLILGMLLIGSVASEISPRSIRYIRPDVILTKNKKCSSRNYVASPFLLKQYQPSSHHNSFNVNGNTALSSAFISHSTSRIREKTTCFVPLVKGYNKSVCASTSSCLRIINQSGGVGGRGVRDKSQTYYQHQFLSTWSSSSSCSSLSTADETTNTATNNENNNDEEESSTFSNYITTKNKSDKFHNQIDQESNSINYPKGIPDGFYIIKQYHMPDEDTVNDMIENTIEQTEKQHLKNDDDNENNDINEKIGLTQMELDRLGIKSGGNLTLPIALMLLDPVEYPSFSKARKACRKGYIIIHRGPLDSDDSQPDTDDNIISDEEDITIIDNSENQENEEEEEEGQESKDGNHNNTFNLDKCIRGRVGDRVYPNDVIGRQVRMHGGFYPGLDTTKPPFDLPVVYEDDHFAIVNKPAGIVIYSQKNQGHGMMTVRAALPFVLRPPKRGTLAIIRRPVSVHRLDKPTAGLLIIAKTKPAMVDITKQFVERRVKKTYTAILNGIPDEPIESRISTLDAHKLGVDVGDVSSMSKEELEKTDWQLIDSPLDDGNSVKSAVTIWRPLEYVKSLKATNGILTKVEMKPKTGRYHQLRRHMAWVKDAPMIGDKVYDGGHGNAMDFRGRGLFLCSNKVKLDHPYYNTEEGRKEWNNLPDDEKNEMLEYSEEHDVVRVSASIDLPGKFESFLNSEKERALKFGNEGYQMD